MSGRVVSVSLSARHEFSKSLRQSIRLLAALGVEGDVHAGVTVKHRSRVAVDPTQPNLRQVHLIHTELFAELATKGFAVAPGDLGENVVTGGIDLLGLPRGTRLRLGADAVVEITGLRNPCGQIEAFQSGLLANVVGKAPDGEIVRKAGVMSIVLAGGEVKANDTVTIELPPQPHLPLERV